MDKIIVAVFTKALTIAKLDIKRQNMINLSEKFKVVWLLNFYPKSKIFGVFNDLIMEKYNANLWHR